MLKVLVASWSSPSFTLYVYWIAAWFVVGVPLSVRAAASNARPSGSAGLIEYSSGSLPPLASGSVSVVIATPCV